MQWGFYLKNNEEYFKTNLRRWNELVEVNAKSKFYNLDGFKSGKSSLFPIELKEIGDVEGKTLLHLQCHFGMDTLSFARMGAKVTGVDFSEKSIELARKLSMESGIKAEFIHSNIFDLQDKLTEKRIPYSVHFHEVKKPITNYALKWIQGKFGDEWNLMRQRFIYGYASSDFSYFSIKHDDGEKLSLSKDGFYYTKKGVINSTKAEIDPVLGIVESKNPGAINIIQTGIVDRGEQPMRFIKYHFTTMFGLFQYFPADKIEGAREGYKNLFSEQLFAANHLSRDKKSQIYLEFNELFNKR